MFSQAGVRVKGTQYRVNHSGRQPSDLVTLGGPLSEAPPDGDSFKIMMDQIAPPDQLGARASGKIRG